MGDCAKNYEIAFFGGSFTAIDRDYMMSLLNAAKPFINEFMRAYGVTSIELGAQSMDNSVLELNKRGHTAEDVYFASALIREFEFSLGLQMMTGLYGSSEQQDIYTARCFVAIKPDTVRIYPTVIMKGTDLAAYFLSGEYRPRSLEQNVSLCSRLILLFEQAGIAVIRLGLHYSDSLKENSLGRNYHPAFKELCENEIFFDSFMEKSKIFDTKHLNVFINEKSLSKFVGQKKSNLKKLEGLGYDLRIHFDNTLNKYGLEVSKCD